jgi:DNA polymerase I-like protein with 3'-5' exonuclease and polymerase domains
VIIRDRAGLEQALSLINNAQLVAYDIETSGLNPRKDTLIGFGVCNVETLEAAYVVLKEWKEGALVEVLPYSSIIFLLEALKPKKIIGHNLSFDTRFTLCQTDVNLIDSIYADTQLMAHTLEEERFNYKLKVLAAEIFGNDVTAEQTEMKASIKANGGTTDGEIYRADSQLVAKYGLQDVRITARLYKHFLPQLEKQGLLKFFFDEEVMPHYRECLVTMELRGFPLNMELLQRTQIEIERDIEALEDKIQAAIKPLLTHFEDWYIRTKYPFKLSGPFRQKLALKLAPANWPMTDSGQFSFNKVDINRAKKKGGLADNTALERYAVTQVERVPEDLIREVQLALLRDEGTKYTFNLLSTDNLKRLFFGTSTTPSLLNETPINTTEKGSPQVDDEFLEAMAAKYSWAADLRDYRSLIKIKGTYVDRFLNEQENGLFYPSVMQHLTATGRLSGDLQQLSRKKSEEEEPNATIREYNNRIRDFFISAPGWSLVDADYSSLEVVVFADDAGDEALLNIIRNGEDFYSRTAIEVHGLKEYSANKKADNFLKNHKPKLRQDAKIYSLGIRYGLEAFKLHHDLKISESEAKKIVSNYFKSFPKLKQRMDELTTSAKKHGFVKSKAGRIRRVPQLKALCERYGDILFDSLELYKEFNEMPALYQEMKQRARIARSLCNAVLNFPIQSYATSIVSRASVALTRAFKAEGLQAYIALSLHDELCVHCPDHEVPRVKQLMKEKMETTTVLSVPLEAEPMEGRVYGEVK